jgi:hypothetical protein
MIGFSVWGNTGFFILLVDVHKGRFSKMKNKWFVGLGVLLVIGFILAGCDTSLGGGDGALSFTIVNDYNKPITKVELTTDNCTIDGLTVLSEETFGPDLVRDYEYTTSIASGTSKTFSVTADGSTKGGSTGVTLFVDAEELSSLYSTWGIVFGTSYNRHWTVTLYSDGVLMGESED